MHLNQDLDTILETCYEMQLGLHLDSQQWLHYNANIKCIELEWGGQDD